jgi:hypothetical protein
MARAAATIRDTRESITREARALREASSALAPLTFCEQRRVLVLILDRFRIDGAKLGAINTDGTSSGI